MEILGHKITKLPDEGLFVPCETGGCWSCAVKINGKLNPSCMTAVKEGMEIETSFEEVPRRIAHGFSSHGVGEVGTPWILKDLPGHVEAACFACRCNFRCPQCQNWTTTHHGVGTALRLRSAFLEHRNSIYRDLVSIGELQRIGERIFTLNAEVQVCVLDYSPEFRNKDISRPSYSEMERVYEILTQTGLKTVTCQTMYGHIGP